MFLYNKDMPQIVDHKVLHAGEKIGWIDGAHIRDKNDAKLGYYQEGFVCNEAAHKIAYIKENELCFENGQPSIPLDKINEEIRGAYPLIVKAAVYALLDY